MRIPRIYQETELSCGKLLTLDERAFKHLIQVLRFEVGRPLIIFNGLGGEYSARLVEANKRNASVELLEFSDVNRENQTFIHLAQGVSKGDRFEFAIQKAVELGVKEITPVFTVRSQLKINHERKDKKQRHWQQIIISACEQSGRTELCQLNDAENLADFIEHPHQQKLILDPDASVAFSSLAPSSASTLLIGPEGGFEQLELELAQKNNYTAVRLGKQVLRTETAPIAAISALHMLNGEF